MTPQENNPQDLENTTGNPEDVSTENGLPVPTVEELTLQISELETQIAQLYEKVQTQETELAEQKDKYLRLYADFENFRKRAAKERIELIQSANEGLIRNILPVVDDFERSLKALTDNKNLTVESAKEGSQLIFNKLYKTLEQAGLKPMNAQGKNFDMELHESITQIPAPTEDLKGKVVDEVEKGYFLHDKVVRFAKVVIGS
jgi:molecular chaperone GrpE